jgi:nicotinate-nucleotide adenylyltransferase
MRAILGGTFDPPHVAHLVAGETAHDQLGVDTVTFIPAGRPWQKVGTAVSEARHRLRMIELAVAGVGYFDVDDREVHRDGWTYTIETVESFEDEEIVLVVGADSAMRLPTWNRAAELVERVRIAVVPRPGVDPTEVERAFAGDVEWLDMPDLRISGTMLRRRVADGLSIRFLVPDPVCAYVEEQRLYVEPREARPAAT